MSLLGMIGGMGYDHSNERRNYRNERNLAEQQYGHQRGLNQQGHDLQMDMWNKTNYGAQVDHMKNAGLNPALMYGSAGQGGTTGSQTGGSASKGNSQMRKAMDIGNMLVGAEIKLKKALAGTEDKKQQDLQSQIDKRDGVDTGLTKQQTSESKQKEALGLANTNLSKAQLGEVQARVNKLVADTELTNRIKEMDYGGKFGKNYFENARKVFAGELDLNTYMGAAMGIAGLTTLRSTKMMGKLGSKAAEKTGGMINALKKKIGIGTKKLDTGGKLQWTKEWDSAFKMLDKN
jgi:hypothetical protein